MNNTKRYLSLIFLLTIIISGNLYSKELKGIVYGIDADEKKVTLQKARLQVLGSSAGTLTDESGKFSINIPNANAKLVVSYTGYKKDTIEVTGKNEYLEISLISDMVTSEVSVYSQMPASVISKSEIIQSEKITLKGLQKAACCNLAESFETNPSVDVNYSDAVTGAKQIQLLGLHGAYTQLLTEKIPNMRGLASAFGLGYIPGPWMQSIQISKGSSSVATGYESITGQINVEYQKPEEADPFYVNLYSSQQGRFEGSVNTAYKMSDRLSTMLMAHGNMMQTKFDQNGDSFLDQPLVRQVNLFNRWKYMGDIHESVTGIKALYEDRRGGQMGYFSNDPSKYYGIDIKTERYEFFTKNGFVFPGERYHSIGTILSAAWHDQNSMFGRNQYDGRQASLYLNVLYQSSLDKEEPHEDREKEHSGEEKEGKEHEEEGAAHKYTVGASYMYDNFEESLNDSLMNKIESVPGAFVEYTYSGVKGLTLMAGLRTDYHNQHGTFITPRFHVKYSPAEHTVFRASAGKGYRTINIYAENTGLLASSRIISTDEALLPEEAWNYGLNATTDITLAGIVFTLNAEYYRTNFINQVILDMDRNPGEIHFYNLDGTSYSNSFQVDLSFEPFKRFTVTTAYRMNDVKMTINGKLEDKPLQSRHKGFLNLAYATDFDEWMFDFTTDYNGSGRLPNTSGKDEAFRLGSTFPAYVILNAQITKKFDDWDVYIGGENLTGYMQPQPILAYEEPFGKNFDGSMVWGPLMGRVIYLGLRLNLFNS